jgi:Zn-dependent M28 family amino/carboxypeptidase
VIELRHRRGISAAAIATGAILAVGLATPAFAASGVDTSVQQIVGGPGHGHGHGGGHEDPGSQKLRHAVKAKNIQKHLSALQDIADANGGTRAAGTPGHVASAEYVEAKLDKAGYETTRQPFSYDKTNLDEANFAQTAPTPAEYVLLDQFYPMDYSGEGDVTAAVTAVDVNITGDHATTSGCEPEDFASFPAGNIALIQRGTCDFAVKATNAEAAGAVGVVIFNQGNVVEGDDREGVVLGTLGAFGVNIPVIGIANDQGEEFVNTADLQLRVNVQTTTVTVDTFNVLASTERGDPTKQVLVGAHLDSVAEGPGINDNGSGSAAILELAIQLAKTKTVPKNQVTFAWWSGEEDNLQGSNYFVSQLTDETAANIAMNLNFDMVGSPNAVNFVYDGDGDAFGQAGPEGSAEIEHVFNDYFTSQDVPFKPTAFDGRSDYFGFINVGIPAGGLFTGAEGIKTDEEAAVFGGTAGEAYDPCYHQACDTTANVSKDTLEVNADAMAHATYVLAQAKTKGGGHHHGGGGHWGDRDGWGDSGWGWPGWGGRDGHGNHGHWGHN